MDQSSELTFLAIIVGLAAYIGAVRFAMLGRLAASPRPNHAGLLKAFLIGLLIPDIAIVAAGICLFIHLFWHDIFEVQPSANWLLLAKKCFGICIGALALSHAIQWGITIKKSLRDSKSKDLIADAWAANNSHLKTINSTVADLHKQVAGIADKLKIDPPATDEITLQPNDLSNDRGKPL